MFIFWVTVVTMGVLLMAVKDRDVSAQVRTLRPLEQVAMLVFLVVIAGERGAGVRQHRSAAVHGPGRPGAVLVEPEALGVVARGVPSAPVSLRGRWNIAKPRADDLPADPAAGPFVGLPALTARERRTLSLPLQGTPTDLAYDEATDRFLVTTQGAVYILDGALGAVVRYTVMDRGFSVDLGAVRRRGLSRQPRR